MVVMQGRVAKGRFFILVKALFHAKTSADSRGRVGKRSLVTLKVLMDVGGAVGAAAVAAADRLPIV